MNFLWISLEKNRQKLASGWFLVTNIDILSLGFQLTWSKAIQHCQSIGMKLASIESQAENNRIKETIISGGKFPLKKIYQVFLLFILSKCTSVLLFERWNSMKVMEMNGSGHQAWKMMTILSNGLVSIKRPRTQIGRLVNRIIVFINKRDASVCLARTLDHQLSSGMI